MEWTTLVLIQIHLKEQNKMKNENIASLIKRRRRQILIHSCIYYRFNTNIVPDYMYDSWGKELSKLQCEHPDISKEVEYYEWFKDFTDNCYSGYNLPIHRPEIVDKARHILEIYSRYDK